MVDPNVEVPKIKRGRGKGAKGLHQRDVDPNSGRDRESAADEAQKKVGSSPNAPIILPFESTLAYVFRQAGGKETAINAARMLTESDERFKRFVTAYDTATDRDKTNMVLEDLCAAADIPPDEFLGMIIPALYQRNVDTGKLIAAINHPKIVEATISAAQGPFGMPDRKMLLDHVGFLPQKQGMQINFDNRHLQIEGGKSVSVTDTSKLSLPSFEEEAIEGIQAIRGDASSGTLGQKRLQAPSEAQKVVVPAPAEVLEAEVVE